MTWEANAPDLVGIMESVLARQLDERGGRAWDEDDAYHASDLAYFLPDDDGGQCARNRVLKWIGAEGKSQSAWDLLMFDQGFAFEEKLEALFSHPDLGLAANGFSFSPNVRYKMEFEGRVWVGESDGVITHQASGDQFIWECKTHRSGAEQYLDDRGAKRAHVVQANWYCMAQNAKGSIITYTSRDGASKPRSFLIPRDDHTTEDLMREAHSARDLGVPADPARPTVTPLKRAPQEKHMKKYPGRYHKVDGQWEKREEFWQCSYCPFHKTPHCAGSVVG